MKKKIFSIILISVLLVTLLIPMNVFASDTVSVTSNTSTIKKGTYRFNDVLSIPAVNVNLYVPVEFILPDVENIHVFGHGIGLVSSLSWGTISYNISTSDDPNEMGFTVYDSTNGLGWNKANEQSPSFPSGYGQTIVVTEDTEVDETFATWFNANTTTVSTTGVTYKTYGTVSLPDIDTVWTDKETFKAMAIFKDNLTGKYELAIGEKYKRNYVSISEWLDATEYPNRLCYFLIDGVLPTELYELDTESEQWVKMGNYDGGIAPLQYNHTLVWTTEPIYTDSTLGTVFFHRASSLVTSLTGAQMTGVMTQIVTILPIGLLCLIGYLALRKGLKILAQTLSRA